MKRASLVLALFVMLAWTAVAQQFRVNVSAPASLGRDFTLLIYDGDSTARILKPKGKKGPVFFVGKVAGTVYAELRNGKVSAPLPFFIENSDISVSFKADNPESSPITGSRSNSILRYQLEQCGTGDADCMARFVAESPSSPLAPYIIDRYLLGSADRDAVGTLYASLTGEAKNAYHYRIVGERLRRMAALAEGCELPKVTVTDLKGNSCILDSLLVAGKYNVIFVGSTYCRQCADVKTALVQSFPDVNTVVFDVDSIAGGWDAPLMQQLEIDHIPYLLLLDTDRRIAARDIRIWELKRKIEK